MTKDVLVAVSGLLTGGDESENVETIYRGTYYQKGKMHYVVYEEEMEGVDKPLRSMMKFKDGMLTVTKKGGINATLVFEEHKKNTCCYKTPYGNLLFGINTAAVKVEKQKQYIVVIADYELETDYQPLASCHIQVRITEAVTL